MTCQVRGRLLLLLLAACGREGTRAPASTPATTGASAALAEGRAMYARGEFDSAAAAFTTAIERARQGNDRLVEGRALTERGFAAWRGDRYPEARRDGEAGLALKRAASDRDELFRSWNLLGLVAWNEGRLLDALVAFDSATAAAAAAGQGLDLGKAAGNRALVEVELGDFPAARRGFELMREAGRAHADARVEGNALTNLAMLSVRVGSPAEALPLLVDARALYRSIEYETGEQTALAQLATAYQLLGRLAEAFAAIDTAVQVTRRLDQPQELAANLEVQADLHRDVGEDRHALALYDEAQRLNQSLGLLVEQGTSLRRQAEVLRGLGQGPSAARAALQSLQAHRSAGATYEELVDLLLLADIASAEGDRPGTERHLVSARALATHVDARSARAALALTEAQALSRFGDAARAAELLRGGWPDLTSGGYDTEWRAWDLRADVEVKQGQLVEAAHSAQQAVALIERVRSGLGSEAHQTSFLAKRVEAYSRLVDILLRLGRVEESFEVADAMRGRALLDHLRGPNPQAARVAGLQAKLDDMARQGGGSAAAQAQLEAELAKARRDAARPTGPAPRGEAVLGTVPASEIAARLGGGDAVLAYFMGARDVHVFVVRRTGVQHLALGTGPADLTARVRLARDMVGRPPDGTGAPVLGALHETLIAPIQRAGLLQGVRHLVIVPQGALAYLPFAALRDETRGRFLAEDYVLATAPSAAAIMALGDGRVASGGSRSAGAGFAPVPDRLPATRAEVAAFQGAVPGATILLGEAATEGRAREALAQPGVVHIASHAEMNPVSPLYSSVELSKGPGSDDGALEVGELLSLQIRSRLVFLSGCETGLGETWATSYRAGEDYATLGQALLYAGAGAVVATLWRIEDRSAAALAARFYVHLRTRPPAEALALAQRDLLADGRHANPYYWAGHVLIGPPSS